MDKIVKQWISWHCNKIVSFEKICKELKPYGYSSVKIKILVEEYKRSK